MNRTLRAFALALLVMPAFTAASAQRDGAIIENSGSTNFSGYAIKVWSDGSTSTTLMRRGGVPLGSPSMGQIPKDLAQKFLADLQSAKRGAKIAAQSCTKSASFGSTTIATYHGWTSPDLTCPGDGYVVALGADAGKIAAALQVKDEPYRRIPMLPNERRRPEGAGASPEPAPSAS